MFKESDIAYETKGGAAWVRRDSKGNRYTVFRAGVTHSTSDSAYPLDANGLSLAKARADYIQRLEDRRRNMKIHYEITYTLPNSDGGDRADAREYSVPEIGDDGVPSDEWYEAVAAEQEWLDEYVKWLRAYGATHIRLSDPSGTLDLR